MVIIDRNITSLDGVFKAGQNVEGVLSESACNDLIKRGWAHKSHAKNEADQDGLQADEQMSAAQAEADRLKESEGDQSEEESSEAEESSDEPEETEDVVIDSLKELDQALEQPTKTSGTSRKRGK